MKDNQLSLTRTKERFEIKYNWLLLLQPSILSKHRINFFRYRFNVIGEMLYDFVF
jgi:hypothetical protein